MEFSVKDIMKKDVHTATEDLDVVSAVKRMRKHSIGSLVVVKDKEAIGIITSTDILYKAVAEGLNLKKVKVGKIMSSPLVTIGPDESLQDAAKIMEDNSIKKLPVIKEDGELVGIISSSDLVAHSSEFLNVLINLAIPGKQKDMGG